MHWILFANGHCEATPRIRALVTDASHVVGVDGGCRHLWAMDVLPHVAVGDISSFHQICWPYITNRKSRCLRVRQEGRHGLGTGPATGFRSPSHAHHPARRNGRTPGPYPGQPFLLSRCLERGIPACVMDAERSIYLTDAALDLHGRVGETISLIPVTPEVHGLTLTGLEYPLHEASLRFGTTWGMSNVFVCEEATVRLREGRILVFHLHGA